MSNTNHILETPVTTTNYPFLIKKIVPSDSLADVLKTITIDCCNFLSALCLPNLSDL